MVLPRCTAVLLALVAVACAGPAAAATASAEAARIAGAPGTSGTSGAGDSLYQQFASPPAIARPRIWWHWLDGNVTRAGIKLDLEWMQRAGIAGFQLFDVAYRTPHIIDKRLPYMSPEWREALRYAISTAQRLGLEAGISSAAGWSETGGPWVQPAEAMKKVVWSETRVPGDRPYRGVLPKPPDVAGLFQDLERTDPTPDMAKHFYRDTLVLAFPLPDSEAGPRLQAPRITSSGGTLDPALLLDTKLQHKPAATLAVPTDEKPVWIRFDYERPHTIRSLSVALPANGRFAVSYHARLESSEDGATFRAITELPAAAFAEVTITFPPVTARAFRVVFSLPMDIGDLWRRAIDSAVPGLVRPPFGLGPPPQKEIAVTHLALLEGARINRFEEQAGFGAAPDYYAISGPAAGADSAIAASSVLELTELMKPDGALVWQPPDRRRDWIIVRMGYSLTGQTNGPAPAEGQGLEVDKLDSDHVRHYIEHYLNTYRNALGPELFGRQGVTSIITDSIEAGPQNWTDRLLTEFQTRRGYDARPFLPALTGRVIGSTAQSERFLWDFRKTIAELLAANHYGEVANVARETGLTVYGEALEDNRPILGDDVQMRSYADVPMGALWTPGPSGRIMPTNIVDLRGAASVAHLRGRAFVGAESLTSALQPWAASPRDLKSAVDAELALGVTRFMLHSSVHQPLVDAAPGMTLGVFGEYFNRYDTWAEQARPWIDYLARNVLLLQQGRYHADVAYFYGEEAPLTGLYGQRVMTDAPVGYGFDFVDAETLLHRLSVHEGNLVTPSGMRYRVLQLGGSSARMTLPVLRKLVELVRAGAIIVGKRPECSPSRADDPVEFEQLAARLWGGSVEGSGRVVVDRTVGEVLSGLGVAPDWQVRNPDSPPLMVLHRSLDDDNGDIYFLSSRLHQAGRAEVAFRVTGRLPELWDADTGTRKTLPFRTEQGVTVVPVAFDPDGSALVIFRERTELRSSETRAIADPVFVMEMDRDWKLRFQTGRGAPEGELSADVGSWTDSEAPGIRYFSGTGTYSHRFDLPRSSLAHDQRIILDLGRVGDIAEVVVNGTRVRTLWKPPYALDITKAVNPGRNQVELRVTNLWVNRLVGDEQPGAVRIAHVSEAVYRADAPLRASGLLGPVRLLKQSAVTH